MDLKLFFEGMDRSCDLSSLDNFVTEFNGSSFGGTAATQGCQCTTTYSSDNKCIEICGYSNFRELVTADVSGDPVIPVEPDLPRVPLEPDPVPPSWTFEDILAGAHEQLVSSSGLYGVKREISATKHGWWMPTSASKANGRLVLRSVTATVTILEIKVEGTST